MRSHLPSATIGGGGLANLPPLDPPPPHLLSSNTSLSPPKDGVGVDFAVVGWQISSMLGASLVGGQM